MALTQQCGFLSVTYFIKILNSDELWQFINNYKVHDLSVDKSQKIRKQSRKKLLLKSSYINTSGNGEQQVYLDHFSYANYMLLSANTCYNLSVQESQLYLSRCYTELIYNDQNKHYTIIGCGCGEMQKAA